MLTGVGWISLVKPFDLFFYLAQVFWTAIYWNISAKPWACWNWPIRALL